MNCPHCNTALGACVRCGRLTEPKNLTLVRSMRPPGVCSSCAAEMVGQRSVNADYWERKRLARRGT